MPPNNKRPWERHTQRASRQGNTERRRVLIVCEDSKSSRFYFEGFPVNRERAVVKAVGTGMNTDSLVEEAVGLQDHATKQGAPFSHVWCVFDRDDFPKGHHFEVAWSNEAFELWYLLHFQYLDTGIGRAEFPARLNKLLGLKYEKSDENIYAHLHQHQPAAIRNARKLLKALRDRGVIPVQNTNPSTNVHQLVEFLNELCELGPVE